MQISVIFILPETKGISLERMDKIFGEVDYVEAGEQDTQTGKIEGVTYDEAASKAANAIDAVEEKLARGHVEEGPKETSAD